MKVIFRGRSKTISAIAQVDQTRIACEELFLGPAFGPVLLPHLSLNPQGEPDCLYFQQEFVRPRDTDDKRENVREYALMLKRIAVFCAGKFLQEVAAHKLLGDCRASLWKHERAFGSIFVTGSREMRCQGSNVGFGQQTKVDRIVHTRMREEVFILGRQYGSAHNIGNFLIPKDVPAFPP